MTAVFLTGHGDLSCLQVSEDFTIPSPPPGWCLVRVKACAINNTDINTRCGWYSTDSSTGGAWTTSLSFPLIQGADVSGQIASVGEGVDGGLVGQRVLLDPWIIDETGSSPPGYLGSELNGGYATHVIVPVRNVHVISPTCGLSFADLASFPTAGGTALDMVTRSGLKAGGYWRAVDVVLDVVGGAAFPAVVGSLRTGGKYVVSGAIGGPIVQLDLRVLYLRDLTFIGATLTSPETFKELVRIVCLGGIKPSVSATFPLKEIKEAQQAFMDKKFAGKIVLDCE